MQDSIFAGVVFADAGPFYKALNFTGEQAYLQLQGRNPRFTKAIYQNKTIAEYVGNRARYAFGQVLGQFVHFPGISQEGLRACATRFCREFEEAWNFYRGGGKVEGAAGPGDRRASPVRRRKNSDPPPYVEVRNGTITDASCLWLPGLLLMMAFTAFINAFVAGYVHRTDPGPADAIAALNDELGALARNHTAVIRQTEDEDRPLLWWPEQTDLSKALEHTTAVAIANFDAIARKEKLFNNYTVTPSSAADTFAVTVRGVRLDEERVPGIGKNFRKFALAAEELVQKAVTNSNWMSGTKWSFIDLTVLGLDFFITQQVLRSIVLSANDYIFQGYAKHRELARAMFGPPLRLLGWQRAMPVERETAANLPPASAFWWWTRGRLFLFHRPSGEVRPPLKLFLSYMVTLTFHATTLAQVLRWGLQQKNSAGLVADSMQRSPTLLWIPKVLANPAHGMTLGTIAAYMLALGAVDRISDAVWAHWMQRHEWRWGGNLSRAKEQLDLRGLTRETTQAQSLVVNRAARELFHDTYNTIDVRFTAMNLLIVSAGMGVNSGIFQSEYSALQSLVLLLGGGSAFYTIALKKKKK